MKFKDIFKPINREKAKSEAFYCIIKSIYYLRPKKGDFFSVNYLNNAIEILEKIADEIHKEKSDIELIKKLVEEEKRCISSTEDEHIMKTYFIPQIKLLDRIVSLMPHFNTD